ncbi:MAG: GlxA family transcriptional regulator [Proteobacteria bacterium]|nr:GlxA family transcriptional regulator [Pseudomonadota bacterium]
MKRVLILAFENTVASTFTGPLDVFHQAGSLFNRLMGGKETPYFDVKLVSLDGKPFETRTGMRVIPHLSIEEAKQADLVVISSMASLRSERYPGAVDWIRGHADRGANIASVCTGAFLLAATGLLDGKSATTHWAFTDNFRKLFPSVNLRPELVITDEGQLFCSAGFTAGMDLSLYLVEKYCGSEVALNSAKVMVYDFNRASQSPYSVFRLLKNHNDTAILKVQVWIENHYSEKLNYSELATRFGFSKRTLERRFHAVTGVTPLDYIRRVRVEASKRLLEESNKSFDEITWEVGYGDGGFFRKIFVKETGLKPLAYRQRFRRAP